MNVPGTIISLKDVIPHREIVLISTISIITLYNTFLFYVILRETPRFMKEYKPYVAQTLGAFMFFEWSVFFGYFPYVIHTEDGGLVAISASIFSIVGLNIPIPLLVFMLGQGVVLTIHATGRSFFFRMMAIQPRQKHKPLTLLFYTFFSSSLCLAEVSVGLMAFHYMETSEQKYGLQLSLLNSPMVQTAYSVNLQNIRQTVPIIVFVLCTGVLGTITMIIYTYRCLYSQRNLMSMRTKVVHQKLFWGLFTQWWTTMLVGATPVFVMVVVLFTRWQLANVFNLSCLFCFGGCGLSLPTVILTTTRPYRQFTLKLLQKRGIVNRAVQLRKTTVTTVEGSRVQIGRPWTRTT